MIEPKQNKIETKQAAWPILANNLDLIPKIINDSFSSAQWKLETYLKWKALQRLETKINILQS